MARRSRRTFSAEFKTIVVLEAIKERETIQSIAQRFEVHPNQIVTWKKEFLENASNAFNGGNSSGDDATRDKEKEKLLATIGQLTVEVNFFKKNIKLNLSRDTRRQKVLKDHEKLSIRKQCELLSIPPSTLYFKPKQASQLNLYLTQKIDKKYFEKPFWGVPRMTDWLRENLIPVNEKRVARLYKLLDLKAIAPGPHTSRPNKKHHKYPYLLRDLKIDHPNQVWATDITCIPMKTGFLYLSAIMDVHSRYIVGWSLSNTMTTEWTTEVMKDAIARFGAPEIVNTDQCSQYTSKDHTSLLLSHKIKISMDGKGRATDNIFIERFWRTLKYEHLKFKDYKTGIDLHKHVQEFMLEYNNERKHTTIGKRPAEIYFEPKAA